MKDPTLYVPVHAGLFTHRKLRRLATRLSIAEVHAVGHLVALWTTALQQTTDGVLRRWDEVDVAAAARWAGRPADLLEALVAEEWLDRAAQDDGDYAAGTLIVRGWEDYAGKGMQYREKEKARKAEARAAAKAKVLPQTKPVPLLSADNRAASADKPVESVEVPRQRTGTELTETKRNETDLTGPEQLAAREPDSVAMARVKPMATAVTRMNRGALGDDERANEPKTVAEYLRRAYDYPHHEAKVGEISFGEMLAQAGGDVARAYDCEGKNDGRMTLTAALEATGWGHWQAQDHMDDRNRWVWPTQAPRRIEKYLRDEAAKVVELAKRTKLTEKRAEKSGVDLEAEAAKLDPVRAELVKVYIYRDGKKQDLPPRATWVDDVIAKGRVDEEMEYLRRQTRAPAPKPTHSKPKPTTPQERAAAGLAFKAFCATVPPQDRSAGHVPNWEAWLELGQPERWTGRERGSGSSPTTPPRSTAVNVAPSDHEGTAVSDEEAAKARAKFLEAGALIGTKKPLMPERDQLNAHLPEELRE